MNNNKPAIVIVGYNRPKSLKRLLDSIAGANYCKNDIPLVISIDKGDDEQNAHVLKIAKNFKWLHGSKTINHEKQNLGLRNHIIQCGNLTAKYGSIILLEDDLFVSPFYYDFAVAALDFNMGKSKIGGISLYNHLFNVHVRKNFSAIEDGYDNWYFQFASSWGEAWSQEQWEGFMGWYRKNKTLTPSAKVPNNVTNWSDKSWLKYYIHYLVETDKYFFYPKCSLTTNFSDVGTHMSASNTIFQVPLQLFNKKDYKFSEVDDAMAIYDSFFENISVSKFLGITADELCIDLYGSKNHSKINKRFLLTPHILNYGIKKSFSKKLKPIEFNVFQDLGGNELFLYDKTIRMKNTNNYNKINHLTYHLKHISRREAKMIFINLYLNRFLKLFKH